MGSFLKLSVAFVLAVSLGGPVAAGPPETEPETEEDKTGASGPAAQAAAPVAKKPAPKPVLHIGDQAPNFYLKVVNAKEIGQRRVVLKKLFQDEATKGVIISFFATWCAPCKKELPVLQQLWTDHQADGLRIVVISIDKDAEAIAGLQGFIEEFGLTFPVVSDRFNLLARRYLGTTTALPSVFITDSSGKIQTIHTSYEDDGGAFLRGEISRVMGIPEKPTDADATKEG